MINKSPFEELVEEDMKLYRALAKRFQSVQMTDLLELNQLTIEAWLLASRWSDIQSQAVQITSQYDVNKTDFSTWAYQKYRQLQEMHITCRSWYKSAKEDYRANLMMEG